MKNKFIITLSILSLLLVGTGAAFAVSRIQKKETIKEVIHNVSLLEGVASPDELAVKVGESIQFNSKDGRSHTITQGQGNDYDKDHEHTTHNFTDSGIFGPDEAFLVRFDKSGIFFFHDHLNPEIYVTVVVYEPENK